MLYNIPDINDILCNLIKDDPVRPEIPVDARIGKNKEILVYTDEDKNPMAVVCVIYQDFIPKNVDELIESNNPSIAVFYTIWSYKPGAGKKLIFSALDHIKSNYPNIQRFVTLSPTTDMAKKFHTKNGAIELSVNETTVNYEYLP